MNLYGEEESLLSDEESEELSQPAKLNPFDFVKSITWTKDDIMNPETEKAYDAYIVNKSLSYYPDTLEYSIAINQYPFVPKDCQYYFYLYGVQKKKRFSQWIKTDKNDNLELVCRHFNYSVKKAKEALEILTKDQIKEIQEKYTYGGTTKPGKKSK